MAAETPPPADAAHEDTETPPVAERSRHVGARPDTVWRVLADPDRRRHVLGGDLDVDLVEGAQGTWRPADGTAHRVHVHLVDAHRRLVFDWGHDDGRSTVDIRLRPTRTGTAVRVVETRGTRGPSPRMAARETFCLAA